MRTAQDTGSHPGIHNEGGHNTAAASDATGLPQLIPSASDVIYSIIPEAIGLAITCVVWAQQLCLIRDGSISQTSSTFSIVVRLGPAGQRGKRVPSATP